MSSGEGGGLWTKEGGKGVWEVRRVVGRETNIELG